MIAGKPLLCVNSYDLFSVSRIYYKNMIYTCGFTMLVLRGKTWSEAAPRFLLQKLASPCRMGPSSYKLIYKHHENYSYLVRYIHHKPELIQPLFSGNWTLPLSTGGPILCTFPWKISCFSPIFSWFLPFGLSLLGHSTPGDAGTGHLLWSTVVSNMNVEV